MMNQYVFVYGTLRQYETNHSIMRGAELISEQAYILGELWDTGNGYPAVIPHEKTRVYGELYRINDEILERIDDLEGYQGPQGSNHYERIEQTVHTDRQDYSAYVYMYPEKPDSGEPISSGDWKCENIQKQKNMLYFAYGSCMDDERFKSAGVDHLFTKVMGRGILKNYDLKFGYKAGDGYGRADIVEMGGLRLEGKLYEIGQETLEYLFVREGVSSHIYRPTIIQVESNGSVIPNVLTFTVIHKLKDDVPPPDWYKEEILRGAKGTVSEEYYEELVARFQSF